MYIHNKISDFITFKGIILSLPEKFFQKLKNIYIINGSVILKIYQYLAFGTVNRFLDKFLIYLETYII